MIALGRLGTHEFDIGSDADIVFFTDASANKDDINEWRRVAERFLHIAGSYTSDGLLLPLDTRLRPRGGEGEIVQSASYLLDYFSRDAEGWEAATYLKARPVAGNIALGEKILVELRGILQRRFSSAHGGDSRELARQLIHTRAKLEQERHEGATGFKSCAGGFFDIDYIVAYLKLSRGLVVGQDDLRSTSARDFLRLAGPELQGPSANSVAQIAFLELRGALDGEQASVLRDAANFYRSLDHAIRLVLGRPSAELPEPAQIPRVSALLEKWDVPWSLPRALHQRAVRFASATKPIIRDAVIRRGDGCLERMRYEGCCEGYRHKHCG